MKSKLLLLLMACCMLTARVSAQCFAHFTYQQNPVNTDVTFYVDSTNPSGVLTHYTYNWSFGDGTAGTSSQIVHTYSANGGPYIACLTMTDTVSHCSFTTCDTVNFTTPTGPTCYVHVFPTIADTVFTFHTWGSANGPATYAWTVNGHAIAGTGDTNTVIIPFNDSRYVCVTATDSAGCVSSDCFLAIDSVPATCNTYASFTNVDSSYTFTASHIGGTAVSYAWYYNNTSLGTTASVTTVLTTADLALTPTICVTITDANGCSSTDCLTLGSTPTGGGCQAYFVIQPDSINSAAGSYIGRNYSSGSFGSNVLWDFGDGSTSTSAYPSHTYATPGQYTICLTVGTAGTTCYDTYCDSSFYAFKTAGGLMSQLTITGPTTGINEANANAALSVYPNPVNDKLTITTTMNIDNEKIFNVGGQLVFERKNGNEINVSKLSAGIYVLELNSGGVLSRMKFVKN